MGSKDRDRRLHQKAGCMSARPSFHSIRTRGSGTRALPAVSSWADSLGLSQRGRPCMSTESSRIWAGCPRNSLRRLLLWRRGSRAPPGSGFSGASPTGQAPRNHFTSRPVDANCCGYPCLTKSCRGHGPKQAEWVFQTVRCGSHMGSKDRDRRLHQKAGCMSARPSFHSIRTRGSGTRALPAVSSWADSLGLSQRGRPCMSTEFRGHGEFGVRVRTDHDVAVHRVPVHAPGARQHGCQESRHGCPRNPWVSTESALGLSQRGRPCMSTESYSRSSLAWVSTESSCPEHAEFSVGLGVHGVVTRLVAAGASMYVHGVLLSEFPGLGVHGVAGSPRPGCPRSPRDSNQHSPSARDLMDVHGTHGTPYTAQNSAPPRTSRLDDRRVALATSRFRSANCSVAVQVVPPYVRRRDSNQHSPSARDLMDVHGTHRGVILTESAGWVSTESTRKASVLSRTTMWLSTESGLVTTSLPVLSMRIAAVTRA